MIHTAPQMTKEHLEWLRVQLEDAFERKDERLMGALSRKIDQYQKGVWILRDGPAPSAAARAI